MNDALEKGTNEFILPRATGLIADQIVVASLGWQPVYEMENSKPVSSGR